MNECPISIIQYYEWGKVDGCVNPIFIYILITGLLFLLYVIISNLRWVKKDDGDFDDE
jgi:hypothetical protein